MLDPATLVAHPRNPNLHGQRQIDMLARIIRHQGWRNPIVVSARSGFVAAGHGRLAAALQLGLRAVPVDTQDFATEADEWAHLVADNRIAEQADMDKDGLGDLLREPGRGGTPGDAGCHGSGNGGVVQLRTAHHRTADGEGRRGISAGQ